MPLNIWSSIISRFFGRCQGVCALLIPIHYGHTRRSSVFCPKPLRKILINQKNWDSIKALSLPTPALSPFFFSCLHFQSREEIRDKGLQNYVPTVLPFNWINSGISPTTNENNRIIIAHSSILGNLVPLETMQRISLVGWVFREFLCSSLFL